MLAPYHIFYIWLLVKRVSQNLVVDTVCARLRAMGLVSPKESAKRAVGGAGGHPFGQDTEDPAYTSYRTCAWISLKTKFMAYEWGQPCLQRICPD